VVEEERVELLVVDVEVLLELLVVVIEVLVVMEVVDELRLACTMLVVIVGIVVAIVFDGFVLAEMPPSRYLKKFIMSSIIDSWK